MPTVAIIGAGVAGLSTAWKYQQQGFDVVVVAQSFPSPFETVDGREQINYSSPWAGAHNRYIPPLDETSKRDHESPEAGITFLKGIEYLEAGIRGYDHLTEGSAKELGYEDFRELDEKDLPKGGIQVVVNCSGTGFGDDKIFVTRGQTCLVANTCDATVTRQNSDGSWSFSVPRNFHGGTVIGGTKEVDDWSTEPSLETRARLLEKFAATYPKILEDGGEFRVLKDIVGRRPTRVGV
ncbi:unnamed protein product [Parascedosporium putredinis]|uniref:FAD dependent oxidoreductase domain-containing protein n=1 Tax=Parascedosporium putredinis TaxID=1442378 RepID=A0A9P1HBJ0_9PEZI|nr:unnamed protein product [Parascedosporium putredinis]CAI8002134.1 unnamed protein product [Parascedosporium putredinis]